MSERRDRRSMATVLEDKLAELRRQEQENVREIAAIEKAMQILQAQPRDITFCTMNLEYAPRGLSTVEAARCSECQTMADDPILGWQDDWKFCPRCGSSVQEVERERSSSKRLTEAAIQRNLAGIGRA